MLDPECSVLPAARLGVFDVQTETPILAVQTPIGLCSCFQMEQCYSAPPMSEVAPSSTDSWVEKILRSFVSGLVRPSGTAVFSALAFVVLVGLTAIAVVDESLVRVPNRARYLFTSSIDGDMYVTSQTMRLGSMDPSKPILVVIGASAGRESIDPFLLDLDFGTDEQVFSLCQGRQSFWEAEAILDKVPDGIAGVVLFSIGPSRFTNGDERVDSLATSPRLGLRTDKMDEAIRDGGGEPPLRCGLYLIDNIRFYTRRLSVLPLNVLRGPPRYKLHRYFGRPQIGEADWAAMAGMIEERLTSFDSQFDQNFDKLVNCVRRLEARTDLHIILVEHPINPRFIRDELGVELYAAMRERLVRRVHEESLRMINLNDAGFEEDEFYDWCHLRSEDAIARSAAFISDQVRAFDISWGKP